MSYNRPDLAVKVNIKTIKGYTMKEIGTLDDRISRLEYYTVLQALETDGNTLSIANNVTGVQRFKNGIFADPFNDFSLSDLGDPEFRIAIDSSQSILRPLYEENYIKYHLAANTSVSYKIQGKVAMIDYDEEKIEANPLGSTYRNPLEGYYSFVGSLTLFPDYDGYTQPVQAAPQDVNIDISSGFKNLMSTPDTGILTHKDISSVAAAPVLVSSTATTNYWSQTTTNTVKDLTIGSSTTTTDLGDVVTDVGVLPYMHARQIMVGGYGLKPSTRVYAFFDNVDVTQYCALTTPSPSVLDANGDPDVSKITTAYAIDPTSILVQSSDFTKPLVTNSKGQIFLCFYIPENKFRTGQRQFTLVNTTDINNKGAILTSASGTYTASSLSVSKKDVRFNVIEPTFNWNTTSSTTTSNYSTNIPPPPDPVWVNTGGGAGGNHGGNSPETWTNSVTGETRYGDDPTDPGGWNAGDWTSDRGRVGGGGGGGKIVCTAMNQTYGFGGFRNAIWLKHSVNMGKEYEVGYHTLFLPLVNYSYNGKSTIGKKIIRNTLENIARHRTSDIWKMSRGKKRDKVGMVYRTILEPICFIVGWTKLNMFNKK